MKLFRVSVTMMDGARATHTAEYEDGFAAVEAALSRAGAERVGAIAAINVRPALAGVHTPVVCIEGYRGPGIT